MGGKVVTVALASAYLTYETVKNIRRWWKGEISGKRCLKNIIDTGFTITGGLAGGVAGCTAGAAVAGNLFIMKTNEIIKVIISP